MVMTAAALHEAARTLLAKQVSPGMPSGAPQSYAPEQSFVPWRDGTNIVTPTALNAGFNWFVYPMSWLGINTSGRYLIENNTDSYLFLAAIGIAPVISPAQQQPATTIPPFTAGIYDIPLDSYTFTCACAGYDFTTPRPNPSPNSSFLATRGPGSRVRVVSLTADQAPAVLPQLRAGWVRRYDWFDLTASPNSPVVLAHGATWNSRPCDFSGAKGVTAGITVQNPSGVTVQAVIYASSAANASVTTYATASGSGNQAGNLFLVISGLAPTGVTPYLQVINSDAANSCTLVDAYVEVTF